MFSAVSEAATGKRTRHARSKQSFRALKIPRRGELRTARPRKKPMKKAAVPAQPAAEAGPEAGKEAATEKKEDPRAERLHRNASEFTVSPRRLNPAPDFRIRQALPDGEEVEEGPSVRTAFAATEERARFSFFCHIPGRGTTRNPPYQKSFKDSQERPARVVRRAAVLFFSRVAQKTRVRVHFISRGAMRCSFLPAGGNAGMRSRAGTGAPSGGRKSLPGNLTAR